MGKSGQPKKIDTLQSVELGEGVEIHLRIAGPFARALALFLDTLLLIGVLIVLMIFVGIASIFTGSAIIQGLMLLFLFVLGWGYFIFFESGKRGATVGKRAMGLRVVDRSGNPATRGQVVVRNIFRFVDMLPGVPTVEMGMMLGGFGVGLTTCLLTKRFQRLGDLVANTLVVYDGPVQHLTAPVPPSLGSVAPGIPLTREEQAAVVAFRERAGLWPEARRIDLANHAAELSRSTGLAGMNNLLGMAHWLSEKK